MPPSSAAMLRARPLRGATSSLRASGVVGAHAPARQRPKRRLFNHHSQLLLLPSSRPALRPQLPYLHASNGGAAASMIRANNNRNNQRASAVFQQQLARLLSTESKARWKQRLRWQLKFHLYFWPAAALGVLLLAGVNQTKLERDHPTPREWSFWSRWFLRSARAEEAHPTARGGLVVDWAKVALFYEQLLARLEDGALDGANLLEQAEGGFLVDGLGKTGWDVSCKSEMWRRGYHQALMGAGKVAEHLDGFVRDTTKGRSRKMLFPAESVIGPGNPRPKPLPYGYPAAPREEDVEAAFKKPEVYYMKILTTKGFSTKQRMDAALAYADWLDFKGLKDTAEEMFDWALDIAAGALPQGANNVVDMKTGVLSAKASESVSANLLKATTALAVHHAQHGNVQAALPIFLSVLRARKDLPAEPVEYHIFHDDKTKKDVESPFWSYCYALVDWLTEAPYPPAPSSGDERPYHTLEEACEEVGLMAYIGEILYATSSKEKGLSWTRDAVDAAEAVMWVMKEQEKEEGKERCRECLTTGLANWKRMAKSMAIEAEKQEKELLKKPSRFGNKLEKAQQNTKRWEEEEVQVDLRKQKTMPLTNPITPPSPSWFAI